MSLTKQVAFSENVLSVLRGMTVENTPGGYVGYLHSQLDRKLYEEVNKALTILGGKWNRKLGGHLFARNPHDALGALLEGGTATVTREGWFRTPDAVIAQMVDLLPVVADGQVLEPSAGEGAIANYLVLACGLLQANLTCVEQNATRARVLREQGYSVHEGDFMAYEPPFLFDQVYMNPPFEEGQDIAHVRRAWGMLIAGGGLAAIMSEGPFFRNDAQAREFRDWLDRVDGESIELPADAFRESGTGVKTRLVVLRK
jgi:hypothetical protein